ncbi:hypothetical protein DID88_000729 [Monilinia fructigena]|uniref:Uncharacterized protein n=1 Tax=Monilinia fructigena TaxID=38457 RepID=A0A395IJP0_9HELO|nr:hypothetical protein DID88_000729 [Monilinia fructigena]
MYVRSNVEQRQAENFYSIIEISTTISPATLLPLVDNRENNPTLLISWECNNEIFLITYTMQCTEREKKIKAKSQVHRGYS